MKERLLELAYVRVRELLQDTNFPRKSRSLLGIPRACDISRAFLDPVRLDHLDRVPLATYTMHSFVHRGKRAFAEFAAKVVVCMKAIPGRTSGNETEDES